MNKKLAFLVLLLSGTLVSAQPATSSNDKGTATSGTSSSGSSTSSSTTGSTSSSPKKPAPGSLEEAIEKALKNNADIRAAEAKVREAEAELNRVRHQVVAKVAILKNDIASSKKMLEFAEKQVSLITEAFRAARGSQQELQTALAALEKQKADVARLETELQGLTGEWKNVISAAFSRDGKLIATEYFDKTIRLWDASTGRAIISGFPYPLDATTGKVVWSVDASTSVQTPMAERIRSALNKPVKMEQPKEELPLVETLEYLAKKAGIDVPIRYVGKIDASVSLMKGELPLGAWLQALEDSAPNVRMVVREYGILVTPKDRVPDGAMTVQEFWKRGDKPTKTEAPKEAAKP